MRVIYINNPYDKNDNDFLATVEEKFDIETMNFMKARNIISFRATPTIIFIHEDLELKDENISCLLDCPTIEDIENALQQNHPYPEQPRTEPTAEEKIRKIEEQVLEMQQYIIDLEYERLLKEGGM